MSDPPPGPGSLWRRGLRAAAVTPGARYLPPMGILAAVGAGFFLVRRLRPPLPPPSDGLAPVPGFGPRFGLRFGPRYGLALGLRLLAAAPLVGSGLLHLLRPRLFLPLLPPPLPQSPALIVATGVPELLGAAGLLFPPTRRAAALCLAVFMVAIFPANIYVAGRTIGGIPMPSVPVRTAMQAAYIWLLLVAGWGSPAVRPTQGHFRYPRPPKHP